MGSEDRGAQRAGHLGLIMMQGIVSAVSPIGVFDSGVGGLSVLRHIQAQLPYEHLIYFADSGFAPYGNKPEHVVAERSLAVAEFLISKGAKALVVACNTATIAAIKLLRAHYPSMPIVGVEPGLKPAAAATRNGKVAVIATNVTIAGEKFLLLRDQITSASQAQFLLQGCPGLVDQIELGLVDAPATVAMLEGFIGPLLDQGADTLVLGCTHYPFVQNAIEAIILARGAEVVLVDTGEAVARRLASLLATADLLNPGLGVLPAQLDAFTTGTEIALSGAFSRLLGLTQTVSEVQIVSKIAIPAVSQQF
jgi:glutamate racemase